MGLPEVVIETLVEIHDKQFIDIDEWDGEFSAVHWAAQHGRRDVIEYLLVRSEGNLLDLRDDLGRTPLFYARRLRGRAIMNYLRIECNAKAPMHAADDYQKFDLDREHLPKGAQWLLEQLDHHGWLSADWGDSYTLLHWAAPNGNSDLCKYLVEQLGADLHALDDEARSPHDCALDHEQYDTASHLEELSIQPA